jgi:hypothetical protein
MWVDKDMIWRAPRDGRPGRPAVFCDAAIQFCLSIKIPEDEQIGTVTGTLSGHRFAMPCRAVDGAYDTRRCHTAILTRDATLIIPIRKNGRAGK